MHGDSYFHNTGWRNFKNFPVWLKCFLLNLNAQSSSNNNRKKGKLNKKYENTLIKKFYFKWPVLLCNSLQDNKHIKYSFATNLYSYHTFS